MSLSIVPSLSRSVSTCQVLLDRLCLICTNGTEVRGHINGEVHLKVVKTSPLRKSEESCCESFLENNEFLSNIWLQIEWWLQLQSASDVFHVHEYTEAALIINVMTQPVFGSNPLYYDLFWMSAHTHGVSAIGVCERVWLIVTPTLNWHSWQAKSNYYIVL